MAARVPGILLHAVSFLCAEKQPNRPEGGTAMPLAFLVTALAVAISLCLSEETTALLSLLLTQLADTLATAAALAARCARAT